MIALRYTILSICDKYPHKQKKSFSVDCHWSHWTVGECTVTCGKGVRKYVRIEHQKALFGGIPCKGQSNRTEPCTYIACPGTSKEKLLILG